MAKQGMMSTASGSVDHIEEALKEQAAKAEAEGAADQRKNVYQCVTFPTLFDIEVKGEKVYGQWGLRDGKKCCEFVVPDHLVEGFEKHYHFQCGNVVKVG